MNERPWTPSRPHCCSSCASTWPSTPRRSRSGSGDLDAGSASRRVGATGVAASVVAVFGLGSDRRLAGVRRRRRTADGDVIVTVHRLDDADGLETGAAGKGIDADVSYDADGSADAASQSAMPDGRRRPGAAGRGRTHHAHSRRRRAGNPGRAHDQRSWTSSTTVRSRRPAAGHPRPRRRGLGAHDPCRLPLLERPARRHRHRRVAARSWSQYAGKTAGLLLRGHALGAP